MPRLDEGFCSERYYAVHLTLHVFYVIVSLNNSTSAVHIETGSTQEKRICKGKEALMCLCSLDYTQFVNSDFAGVQVVISALP